MNPVHVCGVDEAGRGPLAGPVYAAAVILDPRRRIVGLADSKALTHEQREALAHEIRARAIGWSVASASVEEIDLINILQASLLAMRRAVEQLAHPPDRVLVDGIHRPQVAFPVRTVIDGDVKIKSISAASILAKVARDAEMVALHQVHPQYGFDRHKGYPTAGHLAALRVHGVSIIHRKSFEPVRVLLAPRGEA
jgi:ribonuclease HII